MINCSIVMRPNPLKKVEPKKAYACVQTSKKMVNTQFRAYPFYKAPEWVPHKKLLLNSIDF